MIDPQQFGEMRSDIKYIKDILTERVDKLEEKVQNISRWQYIVTGAAMAVGSVGSIFIKVVANL